MGPCLQDEGAHAQTDDNATSAYGMMTPIVINSDIARNDQNMSISVTLRMDLVWNNEFRELFNQYLPDHWSLSPIAGPPAGTFCLFKDSAKVRFSCRACGHCWTSMKGRVVFWYMLLETPPYSGRHGYVLFKLYGQTCNHCEAVTHEEAMWYPEEVKKVVGNVYNRVGQMYYNFYRPPLVISKRNGKPRQQHNRSLCQACTDGVCQYEWDFKECKGPAASKPRAQPTLTAPHPGSYTMPPPLLPAAGLSFGPSNQFHPGVSPLSLTTVGPFMAISGVPPNTNNYFPYYQ